VLQGGGSALFVLEIGCTLFECPITSTQRRTYDNKGGLHTKYLSFLLTIGASLRSDSWISMKSKALWAPRRGTERKQAAGQVVHTGMLIGIAEARIGITSFGRGVEAHDTLLFSIYIDRHGVQAS
jgi:hypothetical protein